jgi:hypothetical protein
MGDQAAKREVAQEWLGMAAEQHLRQGLGLDQKEPVEVPGREILADLRVDRPRRHDVEQCQSRDHLRMIQRHAARHPTAAIVPHDSEPFEAELTHDLDLVLRHRTLGVARVVRAAVRLAAVAISTQVRRDDGEALRQHRSDVSPFEMRLRPALQQ